MPEQRGMSSCRAVLAQGGWDPVLQPRREAWPQRCAAGVQSNLLSQATLRAEHWGSAVVSSSQALD